MNKRLKLFVGMMAVISLLTACSLFSPVETPRTNNYVLNTVPPISTQKTTRAKTIVVTLPEANPIYNTLEMAYTTYPYQVAYFSHNRWADTPAQMLKSLLVQTLQNTHHFKNVVTLPYIGKYDYVLNTQLLELQQDFSKNPSVINLKIRAQLLTANNQLIFSKDFNTHVATSENTPYGGVIAANQAMEELLNRIEGLCVKTK